MRKQALFVAALLLSVALTVGSHEEGVVLAAVNCCEYAFILSDIQPTPGERIDITGTVADQYGAGLAGVLVQYHDVRTDQNFTTDLHGIFMFAIMIPTDVGSSLTNFRITFDDYAATGWRTTVTESYSVETGASSTNTPVLYYGEGTGGILGSYIKLSAAPLPLIIFVGGGYELDFLHGVNQLDQATSAFLDYLAASGFNVIAPIGWYVKDVPSFPLIIGALMRYGFLLNKVFIMGWSAGGIVAAWALTHDFNHIINSGVVMDAELTGPSEPSTRTEYSVFTTAQLAGQVSVPHLLVWGKGNSGMISIQTAGQWFENAGRGLVRVDPLPYSHDWLGTSAEDLVRRDVTGFLKNGTVGTMTPVTVTAGNVTSFAYILTNGKLINATYSENAAALQFIVENSPAPLGIINIVLPKSTTSSSPMLFLDGSAQDASYSQDESNYYIFFSYSQGTHLIAIIGAGAVPEFVSTPSILIIAVLLLTALAPRLRRTTQPRRI